MVTAMAYRARCRKTNADGTALKTPLRVEASGVHRKNCGGVCLAGVACKRLCAEVVEAGFAKEEVNHACIAVEQVPLTEAIRRYGQGVVNASQNNIDNSSKGELPASCFNAPYDDVRHMLLSLNHMMLVLRAFTSFAK